MPSAHNSAVHRWMHPGADNQKTSATAAAAQSTPTVVATAPDAPLPTPSRYEYSSVQVNLPPDVAQWIVAWAGEHIAPEELFTAKGAGIETESHVTVKYGIEIADPALVALALHDTPPVDVTLGVLARFTSHAEFDVLYLSVLSPDLHAANRKLVETLPCVETHPTYIPHVTVAYVSKGACRELLGSAAFFGLQMKLGVMTFSSKDGSKTPIALNGSLNDTAEEAPSWPESLPLILRRLDEKSADEKDDTD